jgi:hypothetical protein
LLELNRAKSSQESSRFLTAYRSTAKRARVRVVAGLLSVTLFDRVSCAASASLLGSLKRALFLVIKKGTLRTCHGARQTKAYVNRKSYRLCTLLASPILCLMLASLGLAAIGAARYAARLTESGAIPAWLPYIFGGAVDLLKVTMFAAGFGGIGRARPGLRVACLVLATLSLVVSVTVQHSSLTHSLQEIERRATHKSETRSDLRTELQEVEARAAAIKAERRPRSPSVIAWDIKTVVIPTGARRNSEDCTTPGDAYTRKACAPLLELRKELEGAEELERLEPRAGKLRKQLADVQIVASRDPASTSFELLIGTLLAKAGVKEIDGTVGFPALMMLLLEMVSASGFYIIGEMYGVLWPAVVTPHMAHLGRRAREQV